MKQISRLIILAAMVVATLSFCSCGKDGGDGTEEQNRTLTGSVQILALAGAGEEALAAMPDGFDVQTSQNNAAIETRILNNDYDLAVVSTNLAAGLYQRSGGDFVAVSPVVLNDWFIVSNNGYLTDREISALRGRTIVACGQGGTGEAVLRKLLADKYINPDYGVRMEWVDTPAEVLEALKERGTVALLQEPFASQALAMSVESGEITSDFDLGALWEAAYGSPIPTDVIIANKQFVSERSGDLSIFMNAFEQSLSDTKESAKETLVFYGQSNRGMELLKRYIGLMEAYDINLLGGESPDATFYYGIGE